MIKLFKVPVIYSQHGYVEVEAKNFDDLNKRLKNLDFVENMPLPDDPEYLSDSYEIDFEGVSPDCEIK